MARGQAVPVGTPRVSANGYHYTKVADDGQGKPGWRLTHHLVAEKKLGRKLLPNERVSFVDKKTNLNPNNVVVTTQGTSSLRRRKAHIEAQMMELKAELDDINHELGLS